MIEGERNELLELGGFMKQGYSAIVTNAGKAIAAVTLIMAILITKREQEYRRLCYLVENGLSATDYEDYLAGVRFGRKSRRILRRARSLRAVKLTPSILLNGRVGIGKSELLGPGRDKMVSGLISLIPTTICTVFTVSIILTAKDGLTATTVIEGIIRLCALPVVGFRGTVDGYNFARDSKSAWLETKARLLESFLGAKA